jgi:hypothetical protein
MGSESFAHDAEWDVIISALLSLHTASARATRPVSSSPTPLLTVLNCGDATRITSGLGLAVVARPRPSARTTHVLAQRAANPYARRRRFRQTGAMPGTRSFYVGPTRPAVQIDTWGDLVAAADTGVLQETQWVECKTDVPTGRNANVELARDLASLSVEGGLLVVGAIDKIEDSTGLVGVSDVDGLRDRIAQVAANSIKPPLNIVMDVVDDAGQPSKRSCILVTVHSSASAPHMVDERYWGRSATGKRSLSDIEVRRLLSERAERSNGFQQHLLSMSDTFDPIPRSERRQGHIYFCARPTKAPAIKVTDVLASTSPKKWLRAALPGGANYARELADMVEDEIPHPDGIMVASSWHRSAETRELYNVQVLLGDDGELRATSCAGTRAKQGEDRQIIYANYHLEFAHQLVLVAASVLNKQVGYRGEWEIGVHATGLAGCMSNFSASEYRHYDSPPYQTESYTSVTNASTDEMMDGTPAVVQRLYGGFVRGLGLPIKLFPYKEFWQLGHELMPRDDF